MAYFAEKDKSMWNEALSLCLSLGCKISDKPQYQQTCLLRMTEGTGLSNFQDTVGVWKPSPSPSNMPNKQPCITIYPCNILYKLKFEQKMLHFKYKKKHFLVMLKKTLYPCKEANFWIQPNMQKRTQNNLAKTTLKKSMLQRKQTHFPES